MELGAEKWSVWRNAICGINISQLVHGGGVRPVGWLWYLHSQLEEHLPSHTLLLIFFSLYI